MTTRVAIIGGGPGGLAAAIALSELSFISVSLYDQSPQPREIGAGLSLSANAWKVLDLLGVSDGVRGCSRPHTHHRNAYNGTIFDSGNPMNANGDKRGAIRARRSRLQAALLARVPAGVIQHNKKLIGIENLVQGVRLRFQDGKEAVVDLVVGADGIHSRIRRTLFPEHKLTFTGIVGWRTLVPISYVAHLEDVIDKTGWWNGEKSQVYCAQVDDEDVEVDQRLFEISVTSFNESEAPGEAVIWGVPATNERVLSHIQDFDARIKEAVAAVPEGYWREFARFSGPRLETMTGWDKVILIGDAAHPLTGAVGSGATFALEDGWILARALEYAQSSENAIKYALQIYNEIKNPFYFKMYQWSINTRAKLKEVQIEFADREFAEVLKARIKHYPGSDDSLDFVFHNNIRHVWEDYKGTLVAQVS